MFGQLAGHHMDGLFQRQGFFFLNVLGQEERILTATAQHLQMRASVRDVADRLGVLHQLHRQRFVLGEWRHVDG